MKTKFTLLFLIVTLSLGLSAQQVPNAGFENWAVSYQPDNWASNDGLFGVSLGFTSEDMTDKAEGNASVKLVSDSLVAQPSLGVIPAYLTAGTASYNPGVDTNGPVYHGVYFPYRPDTLSFAYKYSSPGNDTAVMQIEAVVNDTTDVIFGYLPLPPTGGNWANIYVLLAPVYYTNDTPDTLYLQFASSGGSQYVNPIKGSTLHVDAVHFGYVNLPSSINDVPEQNTIKVYPNPAKNVLYVNTSTDAAGYHFEVMDLTGKIVSNELLSNSSSAIDISNLSRGMYIYSVMNDKNELVGKGKFSVIQ